MKYQVGDKIVVLHSNEEGEVIEIMSENMVMINVRGVKFPAYTDQIDFPYFKWFSEKKLVPEKKKKYIEDIPKEKVVAIAPKKQDGVWLSLLPVFGTDEFGDDYVELFKIHLLNNSGYDLNFNYELQYAGVKDMELKNTVRSFQDFYLHNIPFTNLSDNPSFHFEFSLVQPEKTKAAYFESHLKLRAKQVFAKVEELQEKGGANFAYQLFEKYPDSLPDAPDPDMVDLGMLANAGFKISKGKKPAGPGRTLIDLHIEKLVDSWSSMSNFEILSLQLDEFEKFYDQAVLNHLPAVTVIHGVGSGKLKDEIHEKLKYKKEVKNFINQYHPWYGYGATEINFR